VSVKKKNFGQPSPEALRLLVIHMKNTSLPRLLAKREKELEKATEQVK